MHDNKRATRLLRSVVAREKMEKLSWLAGLARSRGVADQGLAKRPDGARHAVAAGDDLVERADDPAAILVCDDESGQQLDGVACVSGDLTEDLVFLEQRNGDELAEQTLIGGFE